MWWQARSKKQRGWIIVLSVLFIFWLIGVTGENSEEQAETTSSATQQPTQEATEEPAQEATEEPQAQIDITTEAGLKGAVTEQLGAEPSVFLLLPDEDGEILYIGFEISDNLTANLMRRGAWIQVREILGLVQQSGISKNLTVYGTLELIDNNGNSVGQQNVLTVNFWDERVPLFNLENLQTTEQLERAATSVTYHPAFQPEESN